MTSQTLCNSHSEMVINRAKFDVCTSSSFGGVKALACMYVQAQTSADNLCFIYLMNRILLEQNSKNSLAHWPRGFCLDKIKRRQHRLFSVHFRLFGNPEFHPLTLKPYLVLDVLRQFFVN